MYPCLQIVKCYQGFREHLADTFTPSYLLLRQNTTTAVEGYGLWLRAQRLQLCGVGILTYGLKINSLVIQCFNL